MPSFVMGNRRPDFQYDHSGGLNRQRPSLRGYPRRTREAF